MFVRETKLRQAYGPLGELKKKDKRKKKEKIEQKAAAPSIVLEKRHSIENLIDEHETDDFKDNLAAGESNILVAVRLRPMLKKEIEAEYRDIVRVLDKKMVVLLDPGVDSDDVLRLNRSREKRYAFDYAFDDTTSQQEVYNSTVSFLLPSVLNGFNATVFAYGATGSGKTFTMLGTEMHPGIMFLTLQDLFDKINAMTAENKICTVTLSYIEVYNETIRDLLNPTTDFLELREDLKGIKVVGVTELQATNVNQVMSLLRRGNRNRSQEPTTMNEESSRSHAVLQVVIEQKDKTPDTREIIKIGKLSLIDLAGSERASVSNNRGQRLLEGANINRSLLALGNCINALGEKGNKGAYVPYRDSKLTRLLKDSLGGNCRTVMIANISPAHICVEDTTNTLKYANRAKNIKTTFTRNVLNVDHHIAQYTKIISALRSEITELTEKLDVVTRQERSNAKIDSDNAQCNEDFERMRKEVILNFDERMQIRRQLIELEQLEAQNRIDCNKIQVEISQSTGAMTHNDDDVIDSPTPRSVKQARKEMAALMQNMKKNSKLKAQIESQLAEHEERGRALRTELQLLANTKEKKFIIELLYRIHVLELENMELSANAHSVTTTFDEKDLQIQKLRLQLQVRDKIINSQRALLSQNGITYDEHEPYNMLQFNSNVPFQKIDIDPADLISPKNVANPIWSKSQNKLKIQSTSSPFGSRSSPHTPFHAQQRTSFSHTPPASSPSDRKRNEQMKFSHSPVPIISKQFIKEEEEERETATGLEILGSKPGTRLELPIIKPNISYLNVQKGILESNGQQRSFPKLALIKGRSKVSDMMVHPKGAESDEDDIPSRKSNNSQHHMPRIMKPPPPKLPIQIRKPINISTAILENQQYYKTLEKIKKGNPVIKKPSKNPIVPVTKQIVPGRLTKAHTDDALDHFKRPTKSIQSF